MDVRQLEFFLAVVDERNFTRAAEKVFVTQSGLSASIRALERELGVRLFDRGPQGATPTKTGEVFFPRARRMLADARAAQRELLEVSQTETRLVRVGSEKCVGDLVDLVDLMAAFRIDEPQAELSFEQSSTGALVPGLSEGDLDIALIAGPVAGDPWQRNSGFIPWCCGANPSSCWYTRGTPWLPSDRSHGETWSVRSLSTFSRRGWSGACLTPQRRPVG